MYIGIITLIKFALSTNVPSISAVQFSNGAQLLNATCVAAASGCFHRGGLSPVAARVLITTIFPVTKMYASEYSQRLDSIDSIDFVKKFIGL